jgi:hypothetical protein
MKECFMKKAFAVSFVLILAVLAAGCGSTQAAVPAAAPAPAAVSDPNMPPWITEEPPEDMLWGVGISSASQQQLRLTMADAGARADLARQLKVLVQGMVTDYQREAGGIDNTAALGFTESINRQLTEATLQGASRDPKGTWTTPDGKTLWMRVKMSKADASNSIAGAMNKAVESESSRYAEFKAQEALKLLDGGLDKYNSKPEPVTK